MLRNQRILYAVLNWGLGHAARSIPIIKKLLKNNNEIIIASDGEALHLLKKEFPFLFFENLPAYDVKYTRWGKSLFVYLLWQTPKIYQAISVEQNLTETLVKKHRPSYIISDNRYGFYHKDIPSTFITHQLRVLSGITTPVSTKIQHYLIKNFNKIWIPDYEKENNLSGRLSHDISINKKITYIGPVSRFRYKKLHKQYNILIVLSGPEPQRSLLEKKLFKTFENSKQKIALIRGIIEPRQNMQRKKNIDIFNFLLSNDLENIINASNLIISRSGYTSIMDYYILKKKALFIPTPGQMEQIYLAKYLSDKKITPFCKQEHFNIKMLEKIEDYTGFI